MILDREQLQGAFDSMKAVGRRACALGRSTRLLAGWLVGWLARSLVRSLACSQCAPMSVYVTNCMDVHAEYDVFGACAAVNWHGVNEMQNGGSKRRLCSLKWSPLSSPDSWIFVVESRWIFDWSGGARSVVERGCHCPQSSRGAWPPLNADFVCHICRAMTTCVFHVNGISSFILWCFDSRRKTRRWDATIGTTGEKLWVVVVAHNASKVSLSMQPLFSASHGHA